MKHVIAFVLLSACDFLPIGETDPLSPPAETSTSAWSSSETGCADHCVIVTEMDDTSRLDLCTSYPMQLGCEAPSVDGCVDIMSSGACWFLSSCEYEACISAIQDLVVCTDETPGACVKVKNCRTVAMP
jgi:hypothetical protein